VVEDLISFGIEDHTFGPTKARTKETTPDRCYLRAYDIICVPKHDTICE